MSGIEKRRPQAAFYEEWDEDKETAILDSRVTAANSAAKRSQSQLVPRSSSNKSRQRDGSDSGYSSKAGTVSSDPTGRRKMSEVKSSAEAVVERERKPYAMSHSRTDDRSRHSTADPHTIQQRSQGHEKATRPSQDSKAKIIEAEKKSFKHSGVSQSTKKTAQVSSKPSDPASIKSRRVSLNQQLPPLNTQTYVPVFTQLPPFQPTPIFSAQPVMTPQGWTPTSTLPTFAPYGYYNTPQTPTYATFAQPAGYFDRPPASIEPSMMKARRQSSSYDRKHVPTGPEHYDTRPVERVSSRESQNSTKRSSRLIDLDLDRKAMPPPPVPEAGTKSRPILTKSTTFHDDPSDKRRPIYDDNDDYLPTKPQPIPRARASSPNRAAPPSAWRGASSIESSGRPANRKSVSYQDDYHSSTEINRSNSQSRGDHRPTSSSLERKAAEVEEYIQKKEGRSSGRDLSDQLRDMKIHPTTTRSETSSSYSHRSRQSSSRDSMTGSRSRNGGSKRTSIHIGGVSIDVDDTSEPVSVIHGSKMVTIRNSTDGKEPKQIERAPSVSSRSSRKSVSGSATSSSKTRDKDYESQSSHRSSHRSSQSYHADDYSSSKKSSREQSRTRPAHDQAREKRYSYTYGGPVQYTRRSNSPVGGA